MTSNDLIDLGFVEIDENEYSNKKFTIFLLEDNKVSIIGEQEDNFLSIPELFCNNKEDLISFFKLVGYDIQNKD